MEPGKDPESSAASRPELPPRDFTTFPSTTEMSQAIHATQAWLIGQQQPSGVWCAELQGDTILESETILLLAWLGEASGEFVQRLAGYILKQQLPEGGWGLYPGGKADVSVSVKAYFALKLTGYDPDDEPMRRAREAVLGMGGADRVNSFTRFFLALLGQVPYDICPAVPPEAVLLPKWLPVNIYRVSAWSRTILVPLTLVWAERPSVAIPAERGIAELMMAPPANWKSTCAPGDKTSTSEWAWRATFLALDGTLKILERLRLKPLRKVAMQRAERWILARFRGSDGLGAIFPSILWSWIALRCRGYTDDAPEVQECRQQLMALVIDDSDTLRIQPCKSPVWDTALTLRSLGRTQNDSHWLNAKIVAARENAITWLLNKEVREPGDWSSTVAAEPAGWFFEYQNVFYPDTDDTAMVLLALRDEVVLAGHPDRDLTNATQWLVGGRTSSIVEAKRIAGRMDQLTMACQRGRQWLLAMQNRDGGWGAFDRNNDARFLCHVPFADHNAMIDPSTPDLTGRVIEALAAWGVGSKDRPIERAVAYLRRTQESDGSWFGRWGVNYIYGTWQVLCGLRAAGVPTTDISMQLGARWLLQCQQPEGGWGESADSYADPRLRGCGPLTPSQTAWALLGLMAAGHARSAAVLRGIHYLLSTQQSDGTWVEDEFTGTGFPMVFYLRYHYYRIYFPLLALRTWRYLVGTPS
ncbi:MAG: squalene--hopene cyclase [Planctomycetota bacterium]|nr:squalene--hopene cyclase [Planctomycetota bacterium]MDA1178766.1 squalene--hopene cyclase [Planctomycetota bacterium]